MKLHFSASEHDEAKLRLTQLTGLYGQTKIEDATHIVALGGDGHMLHVLHMLHGLRSALLASVYIASGA